MNKAASSYAKGQRPLNYGYVRNVQAVTEWPLF